MHLVLVSKPVYDSALSNFTLQHAEIILCSYSGKKILVLGKTSAPVKYDNQENVLDLIVVEGNLPALFGQDWLSGIKLNWKKTFRVKEEVIKDKFSVPKSETFPASTIYYKNTKIYSAVEALASRISLVP